MLNSSISTSGSAIDGFESRLCASALLDLCFPFEPPFLVFFLLQQSFEQCPRFPQFQHPTESLFLSLLLSLSCPCCPCSLCFPLLLPCRACLCLVCLCLCQTHRCPSGHLLLGVTGLSASCFEHLRGLYTHSMLWSLFPAHNTNSVSHGTAHVSRYHPATQLQVNSCGCPPQECARFLGRLVDNRSVSRDLPSFRWHPSTQAASFAMATKSASRDFVLVPLCAGPTFCATCASSRSQGHLLLPSQRRSSHRES